jgi:hypothetical protein
MSTSASPRKRREFSVECAFACSKRADVDIRAPSKNLLLNYFVRLLICKKFYLLIFKSKMHLLTEKFFQGNLRES